MAFQIKIHQIRAFVEVARQGSARGANRMLNMSQLALNKSIQELGEGLAAQSLLRHNEGVTLAGTGKSFYQHASLIPEESRVVQESIRQQQGQLVGQININIGTNISRNLMPAVISRFHQQYPQVEIRTMEGRLVPMINELCQEELDFAINTYYQGPYDHELTFERLLEEQFAIFCHPGYPVIGARPVRQLLDYSWAIPTLHGNYYKQLSELLDNQAQTPQADVVYETFSVRIGLVAKSDFLSKLPGEMGCDPLYGQGLVMLSVSEILPKTAYYLIQRRDSRQISLTASLITQFRRECGYL